jgi:hypothetical protein
MPVPTWVALILAVLGVLHGPGTQALLKRLFGNRAKP